LTFRWSRRLLLKRTLQLETRIYERGRSVKV
jgi:hypothetical protein